MPNYPPSPAIVPLTLERVRRYASLWKIVRTDGTTLRFTDHDQDISIDGDGTYTPQNGGNPSARQKLGGMKVRNMDLVGALDDSSITDSDLKAGLYRDAAVTETVVDWLFPWAGTICVNRYTVVGATFTGEHWQVQVSGVTQLLTQKVGRVYGRTCDHVLGDARCNRDGTVDMEAGNDKAGDPLRVSDSVSSLVYSRLTFNCGLSRADGYFKYGKLVWTSGANAGVTSEVKDSTAAGRIDLALKTPLPIAPGDAFDAYAGCDHLPATCSGKFGTGTGGNIKNYGGHPTIPGTDKAFATPENK